MIEANLSTVQSQALEACQVLLEGPLGVDNPAMEPLITEGDWESLQMDLLKWMDQKSEFVGTNHQAIQESLQKQVFSLFLNMTSQSLAGLFEEVLEWLRGKQNGKTSFRGEMLPAPQTSMGYYPSLYPDAGVFRGGDLLTFDLIALQTGVLSWQDSPLSHISNGLALVTFERGWPEQRLKDWMQSFLVKEVIQAVRSRTCLKNRPLLTRLKSSLEPGQDSKIVDREDAPVLELPDGFAVSFAWDANTEVIIPITEINVR